ncbi:MAG: type II CAAX prenyl endopeptidase Rce1 family protein, partial [Gemmatimonadales bacterium]
WRCRHGAMAGGGTPRPRHGVTESASTEAPAPRAGETTLSPERWPWALVFSSAIVTVNWYFARTTAIATRGHDGSWLGVSGLELPAWAAFLLTFALLGVGTALVARPILGRRPVALGMGGGERRQGLVLLAIGLPVGILIAWSGARDATIAGVYPLADVTLAAGPFALHAALYGLYYLGFEYHFRGFLLLGLKERIGPNTALVLQAALATLAHVGKPGTELAIAFPGSLALGWITLRTGSIWYALAIHWVVGVAMDWFILASP